MSVCCPTDDWTCRAISIETLHDIDAFVANTTEVSRCFEWYSVFFALQAALTLLLSCLSEPQHADIGLWHQVLTSTAGWFRRMTTMASVCESSIQLIIARTGFCEPDRLNHCPSKICHRPVATLADGHGRLFAE